MRFLLDNDVDNSVAGMLRRHGHTCLTASEVGLTFAADDEYTVFASRRSCALISHDNEFSRRRRRQTIGQHIHLRCEQPDGPDILEASLERICLVLEHMDDVWVEVSRNALKVEASWN